MARTGAGDEPLTLPPLVEGTVRGELELRLGPLVWERPEGSAPRACAVPRARAVVGRQQRWRAAACQRRRGPCAGCFPTTRPAYTLSRQVTHAYQLLQFNTSTCCLPYFLRQPTSIKFMSIAGQRRVCYRRCAMGGRALCRALQHAAPVRVPGGRCRTDPDPGGPVWRHAGARLRCRSRRLPPPLSQALGPARPYPRMRASWRAAAQQRRLTCAGGPSRVRPWRCAQRTLRQGLPTRHVPQGQCVRAVPRPPQQDTAEPEEPRRRDAVPAPVPWSDAWGTSGALGLPCSGEAVHGAAHGSAAAELQEGPGAPSGDPPGVWWSGELRGWQAQAAPPGQARAWQQGACFGAVPLACLAAWQAQAQAQGAPLVPPAWSRQAAPAQPVFVPPWPAYAQQAWLAALGAPLAAAPQAPAACPGPQPSGLGQGRAAAPESAVGAAQGVITQGLGGASPSAGPSGGGLWYPGKGCTRRRHAGNAGSGRVAGAPLKGMPGGGEVTGGPRAGRSAAAAAAARDGSSSDSSADGDAVAGAVGGRGAAAGQVPLGVGAPGRLKRARKARPSIYVRFIGRMPLSD